MHINQINEIKQRKADISRRRLGCSMLSDTASKVLRLLKQGGFPGTIIGGYAVQHHGYPRFTEDIDISVTDKQGVRDYLSTRGFQEAQGGSMTMYDRSNRIQLDIVQSGDIMSPKSLPNPEPKEDILPLPDLISSKLSTYLSNKGKRAKDLGDASELIQRNELPRDYKIHPEYQRAYEELWDQIQADNKR